MSLVFPNPAVCQEPGGGAVSGEERGGGTEGTLSGDGGQVRERGREVTEGSD